MDAKQIPLPSFFPVRATFDQFWPGENRQLVNHLRDVATGSSDTLLYLWGPRESGKSHLLQAACHLAHQAGQTAFYLPSRSMPGPEVDILEGLDDLQLVCIDDVEGLLGDDRSELGLVRLYNALRDRGHSMVVSSAMPPGELPAVLPDLQSRLTWGPVYRIQVLNDEDTVAAIGLCAAELGLRLPNNVQRYLMERCQRDFAFLRRLLHELDRETLIRQRGLTIPLVKQVLGRMA